MVQDILCEFQEANNVGKSIGDRFQAPRKWLLPVEGSLKLNTYAAILSKRCLVGVGLAVRDHLGNVLGSSAQIIRAGLSPQVAEAIVVLQGIVFTYEAGLLPMVIKCDSLSVVNSINSPTPLCFELGIVVTDIWSLLAASPGSIVTFQSRQANRAAHGLPKFALFGFESFLD
ncbi:hypothetical protein ACOSQ4_009562 [Xanthoceras sorbifolium]